jgi:hypothetical protein
MKNLMRAQLLFIVFLLLIGCDCKKDTYKTERLFLKQLDNTDDSGYFILGIWPYESGVSSVKIAVLFEGSYQFIEMPLRDIRIVVEETETPYLVIHGEKGIFGNGNVKTLIDYPEVLMSNNCKFYIHIKEGLNL